MKTTPTITGTRYVLAVKNLTLSASYYRDKLGFETVWSDDGWHFLQRGAMTVMLGEFSDDVSAFETNNHSYFAYVNVENIDALHDEFKLKGVELFTLPQDKPWGQREFGLRTIDGHRITFGQAIAR